MNLIKNYDFPLLWNISSDYNLSILRNLSFLPNIVFSIYFCTSMLLNLGVQGTKNLISIFSYRNMTQKTQRIQFRVKRSVVRKNKLPYNPKRRSTSLVLHTSSMWQPENLSNKTRWKILWSTSQRRIKRSINTWLREPCNLNRTNSYPKLALKSVLKNTHISDFILFLGRITANNNLELNVQNNWIPNLILPNKKLSRSRPKTRIRPYLFLGLKRPCRSTYNSFSALRRPKTMLDSNTIYKKRMLTPSVDVPKLSKRSFKVLDRRIRRPYKLRCFVSKIHRLPYRVMSLRAKRLLRTSTVSYLIKHLKTYSRSKWTTDDYSKRPLSQFVLGTKKTNIMEPLVMFLWPIKRFLNSVSTETDVIRTKLHGLYIKPTYTHTFTRSIFFFTNFILLNSHVLKSPSSKTRILTSPLRHHIFASSNNIKVSIFRSLNSRRSYLNRQKSRFSEIYRFLYKPKTPKKTTVVPNSINKNLSPHSYKNAFVNGAHTWTSLSLTRENLRTRFVEPKIRRVRFKPGYSRIWRIARLSAKEIFGLTTRYQYRLTPKLQKFYFDNRKSFETPSYLTLGFLVMSLGLAPDAWSMRDLLKSNNLYLNGYIVSKENLKLFQGDFLQLVVHLKFYMVLKWLRNSTFQKMRRVNKIFYRKFKPTAFNRQIKTVRTLPNWFYDLESSNSDIIKSVEFDYFTLSTFIIYSPLTSLGILPIRKSNFNNYETNMYNWKYIT